MPAIFHPSGCPAAVPPVLGQRFSATLRLQTRRAHAATEAAFALDDRLADIPAYAALLVALRSIYAPAEMAIGAVVGWQRLEPVIDTAQRCRLALLDQDLDQLGSSLSRDVPSDCEPPCLDSLAKGLGCLMCSRAPRSAGG